MRGVWIPSREFSQKLGSMPDKTRVIVYPLCSAHEPDEETMKQIDDYLLSHLEELKLPNYSN